MNKFNPNINSNVINPLSIVKPQYKDSTIEDIYISSDDEVYISSKGYVQNHNVIIVKRICPDIVKKFACPFNSKGEAIKFMKSLYLVDDVIELKNDFEESLTKVAEEEVNSCKDENIECKNKNFSFGYDDDYNLNYYNQKPSDKEKEIKEQDIRKNKIIIDSGIF